MNIIDGRLPKTGNYRRGRQTNRIEYIVIHYTANKGDSALNNTKYFANYTVEASAHYFVDEIGVYTSVPVADTAWHCGGKKLSGDGASKYGKCTNSNSIGIEMCLLDKSGNIRDKVVKNTIELTKWLMVEYDIPAENVIRHWDVTNKACPKHFIGNNNALWNDFKQRLIQNGEEKGDDIVIYNTINEVPEYARPTIQKICDKGFLKGNEKGLGLSVDMTRILVILDRTGVFG